MESYEKIKKVLALGFMNFLDENNPNDKMCLSNGECADIEKAFNEKDWPKLARYLDKYTESEDERIRKAVVSLVYEMKGTYQSFAKVELDKMVAWLEKQKEPKHAPDDLQKSFEAGQTSIVDNPEQYGLCKKPAWSEEDERILKGIIGKIDHDQTYGVSKAEMLSFLKSLRPQPHWKPSKEQMEALMSGLRILPTGESYDILLSLYNYLKKL